MEAGRDAEGALRARGLKATKGRLEVMRLFFEAAGQPLAQREIMEKARLRLNRANLYRILKALLDAGIIQKAYAGERGFLFELAGGRCHPHFSCRGCGMTACLEGLVVRAKGTVRKGFLIEKQSVLIEGLCPSCK